MVSQNRFPGQKTYRVDLICLLGWVAFGLLTACSAWSQQGGARINGWVKAKSGERVGSARVSLVDKESKKTIKEIPANADGSYARDDIPPGTYSLVASDGNNYKPQHLEGQSFNDGDEKVINFFLERAVKTISLGGTAKDSQGNALAFVDVILRFKDWEMERTQTNRWGQFLFLEILVPMKIEIATSVSPELATTVDTGEVLLAAKDSEALLVNLTLNPNNPASGLDAVVAAVDNQSLPLSRGVTDTVTVTTGSEILLSLDVDTIFEPPFRMDVVDLVVSRPQTNTWTENGLALEGINSKPVKAEKGGPDYPFDDFLNATDLTRGSNYFHGGLQYVVDNDAFDARHPFNLPGFETFRRHDGNGWLGGRLVEDSLFFFLRYELSRSAEAPTFSPVLVSRLPELNRRLVDLGLPPEDPRRFLTTRTTDAPGGRLDYFGSGLAHELNLQYQFQNDGTRKVFSLAPGGTSSLPSSTADISAKAHFLKVAYNWNGLSRLFNQVLYAYRSDSVDSLPAEPNEISILIPGLALLGRTPNAFRRDSRQHLFSETLMTILGGHSLRMGGQFEFDQTRFNNAAFESGRAIVSSLRDLSAAAVAGGLVADPARKTGRQPNRLTSGIGRAELFQIGSPGPGGKFDVTALNLFFSDAYKITYNFLLTLNLGYKAEFPPAFQAAETNGLQPGAGFAWDIKNDGRTLLRASYGLYRARLPQTPLGYELLFGGQGLQPNTPAPTRQLISYANPPAATNAINLFLAGKALPPAPQMAVTYDRASRSPAFQTIAVSLSRVLTQEMYLQFAYTYQRGSHLLTSTNINLPPPVKPLAGEPDFGFRALDPAFAQIYQFQTAGNSSYHGGGLSLRRIYSRGFKLEAAYSFSKTLTDVASPSLLPFESTPENVFDRRQDRAISAPQHLLQFWASEELGRFTTRRMLQRVLDHFSLLEKFSYQSGNYFNVLTGSDENHDGNPLTDRPGRIGRNTFLGQRFAQLDTRLTFNYGLWRETRLRVWANFNNLLNRTNFADFQTVFGRADLAGVDPRVFSGRRGIPGYDFRRPLTAEGFGLASRAYPPRHIQLGASLRF